MAERHLVTLLTERFRTSLDPLWVRIRHLLIGMDLDPLSMALAYFEEEDFRFRFGVLVNGGGRVFQFGFDFAGKKSRDGVFTEWRDVTASWRGLPMRGRVEEALSLLERERGTLRS